MVTILRTKQLKNAPTKGGIDPKARASAWKALRGMISRKRAQQILRELKRARKGWDRTSP